MVLWSSWRRGACAPSRLAGIARALALVQRSVLAALTLTSCASVRNAWRGRNARYFDAFTSSTVVALQDHTKNPERARAGISTASQPTVRVPCRYRPAALRHHPSPDVAASHPSDPCALIASHSAGASTTLVLPLNPCSGLVLPPACSCTIH
eukprot:SAG11_NODE_1091_length_5910_cov_4.332817_2_plen_152_part_00